jgi:hypothetical protein
MKKIILIIILISPLCFCIQCGKSTNPIVGTKWAYHVSERHTDSLNFISPTTVMYSNHTGYDVQGSYTLNGDTIIIDIYDYGPNSTLELITIFKLIIREDELDFLYVAPKEDLYLRYNRTAEKNYKKLHPTTE